MANETVREVVNVFFDLGLSYVFTILKKIPKDAKAKRQHKNVMLKIFNNIKIAYADDEDFQ